MSRFLWPLLVNQDLSLDNPAKPTKHRFKTGRVPKNYSVNQSCQPPYHDHGPGDGDMPHSAQVSLRFKQLQLLPGGKTRAEKCLRVRKLFLEGFAEPSQAKHICQKSIPKCE